MRAVVTAVIAAIEAAAVALMGMAVVVVPAALLWAVTFDLAAEPVSVFAGAIGVWFLAHLVPIGFDVGAEAAVGLGLPQQAFEYPLSLAPLGLTCVTIALAVRAGLRFGGRGGMGAAGVLGGMVGFGAVALAALPVAAPLLHWSPEWSILVPVALYGACATVGFCVRAARDGHDWWLAAVRAAQRGIARFGLPGSAALPDRAAAAVRIATALLLAVTVLAAVAVAVTLVVHYVQVVTLSQSLQLDPLGALVVFLMQLVLLPVLAIWAASWLTGAGFALGSGSSVTPFETLLGPVPAVPMFGAIPAGWDGAGLLAPTLVVLVAVAVGTLFSRRPLLRRASWAATVAIAVSAAVGAGLVLAGAGALASGGIGPDRLTETGPSPWVFGGFAAAELCVGLVVGLAAGRVDARRVATSLPGLRGSQDLPGEDSEAAAAATVLGTDAEQETVPLDEAVKDLRVKVWPRAKRAEQADGKAALESDPPQSGSQDQGQDQDDVETGVIPDSVSDAASAPTAAAAGPAAASGAEEAAPGPAVDADADADDLLRAYSWDQRDRAGDAAREAASRSIPGAAAGDGSASGADGEAASKRRRGWPFGRRDG